MLKRIDQSSTLANLVEKTSSLLARQRGLPVVIGIGFIFVGFVVQIADVYIQSHLLELLGVIAHNVGVLLALLGLLLADPLGK